MAAATTAALRRGVGKRREEREIGKEDGGRGREGEGGQRRWKAKIEMGGRDRVGRRRLEKKQRRGSRGKGRKGREGGKSKRERKEEKEEKERRKRGERWEGERRER